MGTALLGSTAYAADAVVISEPEPMEYVRICEAYGVGFYYIPGTETCLKVSGYVRMDIGAGAFGLTDVIDKKHEVEDNCLPGSASIMIPMMCGRVFRCGWIHGLRRNSAP